MPEATESEIGWQVVREMSIEAAKLLEPIFEEHKGRNGRLSMRRKYVSLATPAGSGEPQ